MVKLRVSSDFTELALTRDGLLIEFFLLFRLYRIEGTNIFKSWLGLFRFFELNLEDMLVEKSSI